MVVVPTRLIAEITEVCKSSYNCTHHLRRYLSQNGTAKKSHIETLNILGDNIVKICDDFQKCYHAASTPPFELKVEKINDDFDPNYVLSLTRGVMEKLNKFTLDEMIFAKHYISLSIEIIDTIIADIQPQT